MKKLVILILSVAFILGFTMAANSAGMASGMIGGTDHNFFFFF